MAVNLCVGMNWLKWWWAQPTLRYSCFHGGKRGLVYISGRSNLNKLRGSLSSLQIRFYGKFQAHSMKKIENALDLRIPSF